MEKIMSLLVLSIFVCSMPVFSCAPKTINGVITGGACSITELQNLEKNKTAKSNVVKQQVREREQYPVEMLNQNNCLFGKCLYRKVLENEWNRE